MKDEKLNLNSITIALKSSVNCETLGEMKCFKGICFKSCQYAIVKPRIYKQLTYVSIKYTKQICKKLYNMV